MQIALRMKGEEIIFVSYSNELINIISPYCFCRGYTSITKIKRSTTWVRVLTHNNPYFYEVIIVPVTVATQASYDLQFWNWKSSLVSAVQESFLV